MAKKKVVTPRKVKPANMSLPEGQKALVIGAFTWGTMRDDEKAAAIQAGVMVAMAPHQWEAMMHDQQIQSQARDNLREELRVSNLKLSNLETRFRDKDIENMHHVEALRSELSGARQDANRITRAMHALIDGISPTRGQNLSMAEVVERLKQNGARA